MSPSITGKTLLNQYKIEEFITSTALGEMYRATDEKTNKPLALTLLPKHISDDVEIIKNLEAKSKSLQNIRHPNLNKYFGIYQTPTLAFLIEEWVDGPSLTNILDKHTLSADEVLIYIKAICNALEALHLQNFLHHQLSPELIHINKNGEIVLSGIANAISIGEQSSPAFNKRPALYTSPETFNKKSLSTASDIYSLAVIIYQLLTGVWLNGKQAPKTNDAIRKTHLESNPPAPISLNKNIPDHFSRMVLWALRKNPNDRFQNTTELLSALALALQTTVDKIPLHATGIHAPVTSAVLNAWSFLPPPKPTVYTDALPLEDRLASVIPQKKKSTSIRIVPIFLFVLFAGFLTLLFFIRPAEVPISPTFPTFTAFVPNITPPPTFTSTPKPVDPHGGRIVFTCTRDNYNQLCLVNRDGSGFTQLTDMAASNYYPIFTPDGNSLLFASNRNGAFDFYLLAFNQKEVLQITNNVGNVISPDYSPDGRQIVFANKVGDTPTSIWMVNADGLNPRLVYAGVRDIASVAWSPNAEKIAYAISTGITGEYDIYTMDINGRNHLKISQGLLGIGGSVDWSPDGNYLLIYAGAFGEKDIFKIEVATGTYFQLTNGGNNAGASFSPDGNYIVFNSLRNNDQADLYIMRADGTNQVQLTNDPEPDWGAMWID